MGGIRDLQIGEITATLTRLSHTDQREKRGERKMYWCGKGGGKQGKTKKVALEKKKFSHHENVLLASLFLPASCVHVSGGKV